METQPYFWNLEQVSRKGNQKCSPSCITVFWCTCCDLLWNQEWQEWCVIPLYPRLFLEVAILFDLQLILYACIHISWKDRRKAVSTGSHYSTQPTSIKEANAIATCHEKVHHKQKWGSKVTFGGAAKQQALHQKAPPACSPPGHPAQPVPQAGLGRTDTAGFRTRLYNPAAHFQLLSFLQSLASHA